MNCQETIRRFIAGLLLFCFSITALPKEFLHEAIADHKDYVENCNDGLQDVHLHQGGTDCHFDQLVVTAGFDFSFQEITFNRPQGSSVYFPKYTSFSLPRSFETFAGRGPPLFG